jgi:Putative zinc-finger
MHPNELVLNDYVDDALTAADRGEVERHLAACDSCRDLVADLREIARAATTLEPLDPPARVWPRIEQMIRQERAGEAPRDRAYWKWLAAAAVLALATLVGLRLGPLSRQRAAGESRQGAAETAAQTRATPAGADTAQTVETELRQAEEHYDKAITGLEQIANANQNAFDPGTAAALHKNLAVIDQAISESRAAVHAQPNSEPAQQSLLENFRTKIAVLQDTVALINEMRKGNEAGAARIVSGLKQKGD